MFKIQTLNAISDIIHTQLSADTYTVSKEETGPDAIRVRSAAMHDMEFNPELKAIGRAGARRETEAGRSCPQEGLAARRTRELSSSTLRPHSHVNSLRVWWTPRRSMRSGRCAVTVSRPKRVPMRGMRVWRAAARPARLRQPHEVTWPVRSRQSGTTRVWPQSQRHQEADQLQILSPRTTWTGCAAPSTTRCPKRVFFSIMGLCLSIGVVVCGVTRQSARPNHDAARHGTASARFR